MKILRAAWAGVALLSVGVCPAGAQPRMLDEPRLVQQEASADLDGDGNAEWVRFTGYGHDRNALDHFVLDVNGVLHVQRGEGLSGRFFIVDIDSSDAFREIAVTESGPSDDPRTYFFRYATGTLISIGDIPDGVAGPPAVDGSGTIHATCRGFALQTWFYPCEYRLDRFTHRLEKGPAPYRPMGTAVTMKVELPLWTAPGEAEVCGVLHPGDRAVIVKSDDQSWCFLQAENGTRGWFGLVGCCTIAVNGLQSTDVFDGLSMAD